MARPEARPGDHLSWLFSSDDELIEAATTYLADGLDRGERLLYVADRPTDDALLGDLAGLGDVGRLVADGTLSVQRSRALYAPGEVLDGPRQVATYRRMTEDALAAGFTGFRVAADATALVTDPDWRRDFLAYELAVDRYIASSAMVALCAYDERILGTDALDLACVHPGRHVREEADPGFHVCAAEVGFTLAGELDHANRDLFRRAVDAAVRSGGRAGLAVDVGSLAFVDAAALAVLAREAEVVGPIRLHNADARIGRLVDLLGFDRLLVRS